MCDSLSIRSLALYQFEEGAKDIIQYVDRHYEWARRLRRQRRVKYLQAFMAALTAFPASVAAVRPLAVAASTVTSSSARPNAVGGSPLMTRVK